MRQTRCRETEIGSTASEDGLLQNTGTSGVALVDITCQPRTRRENTSTQNAVSTYPDSVQV